MHNFHRLILVILFLSTSLPAQTDFDQVEIKAQQLTDSVYMLTGSGGNIGVSIGADGVFIIDDQYAPLTDRIRNTIGQLTTQPLRFVINTHWHGDHTGGNEAFAATGSIIVAHDNVRKRMSSDQFMAHFQRNIEAAPAAALPLVTFSENLSLHLNGETVTVYHLAHAHTDGDSIVHWPDSNVLHMGDIFFHGNYPFIDVSSGGSIDGMITAVARGLELTNHDTIIIPGHGAVAGREDLVRYHAMLIAVRDKVVSAKAAGLSLGQAISKQITASLDADWGQGFIKPVDMITFAWRSPH